MSDSPANPIVARLYDPVMAIPERTVLPEYRESLVSGLEGDVLDLGAGTGAMFPYFEKLGDTVRVTAVEPDPYMRKQARKRASGLDVDIDVVDANAENLPFAARQFDAVVAAFVFCTIPNHETALSEVARVLEDGGEFRFLEHVRGDGVAGHAHDVLAPWWHAVAGGCNLNRETDLLFLSDDRFQTVEFDRKEGLSASVMPIVQGRLKRRKRSLLSRAARHLQPI